MKNNFISGIIFSNMHDAQLPALTQIRSFGSVPFGGKYRLIDFVLSNMVKAKIGNVGVVAKSNYKSLMDHLGSGRDWDLARKGGGLVILPPFAQASYGIYLNRLDALTGAFDFVTHTPGEYIVMSDCNYIFNVNYADAVQYHIDNGADITCVYKNTELSAEQAADAVTFEIRDSRITGVRINPSRKNTYCCGLNNYIVSKEFLARLIEETRGKGLNGFEEGVLQAGASRLRLIGYPVGGKMIKVGKLEDYYAANMSLLDDYTRAELFSDHPVYTKVRDEMPTRYGLDASISGCIVAEGGKLDGSAEHSVLFRGVVIEKGAEVKNSILLQGSRVCAGARIDSVICDKNAVITEGRVLTGNPKSPLFVEKGKTV